jgi:A/G-specific adenine glycosylase
VAVRPDGSILVRKRPESGLLGGMTEVPTSSWTARADGDTTAAAAPFAADWRRSGEIAHVFTHFALDLVVYRADVADAPAPAGHRWVAAAEINGEAFPTVIKKAIEAAIPGATRRVPPSQGQT